jgi:hypothetical protein
MSEKLLLNLLYVLAALAFWLLPLLLRWYRKKKAQEAVQGPAREPEPFPEVEEIPDTDGLVDPLGAHLTELAALMASIDDLAADAQELRRASSGPGLSRFNPLIDETITTPLAALRRSVQAGIDDPGAIDPYRLVAESSEALMRMRSAATFIAQSAQEHRLEGHAERNARGRVLARVFLARLEGLLHKGAGPPSSPVFLPVEHTSLLHPDLLTTLARARAVPFDARAGRSPSPRAWVAVARDVARWAYRATPDLEDELEERYARTLQELGYRAALPPEGLAREVFIHALCGLVLGPAYGRAVESGAEGVGGEDIARRMLELSRPQDEQLGELALPIEILLHVLDREPLEALSDTRLTDISPLRLTPADAESAAAAARNMLEGSPPSESDFLVVAGALLAGLDHPQAAPAIVAATDRALGLAVTDDAWKQEARPARARPGKPAAFLSARAVREAILVGALMER